MKKYIVGILLLLQYNLYSDTAIVNLNGDITNNVKISESSIGYINLGTSIDVLNGSFINKTTTFRVKANSTGTTYNVWLTANNYDSTNSLVYASQVVNGNEYRLPIKVTLQGNTLNIGNDGVVNSGIGSPVNVNRTIAQNNNSEIPNGSGKNAGEDVWGTNINGSVYTISIDQFSSNPYDFKYNNVPSGTYTVTLLVNLISTN